MIPSPPSRLDHAKRVLGKRWGEDRARGCYTLDGRPCNATDLLRAAAEPNASLARGGVTQAEPRTVAGIMQRRRRDDVPRTVEQAKEDGI